MKERITINEDIYLPIPIEKIETYEQHITMQDILSVSGYRSTDIFVGVEWYYEKESGFGIMDMDYELKTYCYPKLVLIRKRPETDEEYFKRVKLIETIKKQTEERERLEYLRLKAKFEKE